MLLAGSPVPVTPQKVAANVDAFLVAGRSRRAWRVRVLLELVEALPWTTDRRGFSALPVERRRAIVEDKWLHGHRLWRICAKTRNLAVLGAYTDPCAAAATGYVPVEQRPRFRVRLAVAS